MDDKVLEVNGVEVYTPEDMMILLKEASTSVTMKIVPSYRNMSFREQVREDLETEKERNSRLPFCESEALAEFLFCKIETMKLLTHSHP